MRCPNWHHGKKCKVHYCNQEPAIEELTNSLNRSFVIMRGFCLTAVNTYAISATWWYTQLPDTTCSPSSTFSLLNWGWNEKMCKVDYCNQEPAIKELTDIPLTDHLYSWGVSVGQSSKCTYALAAWYTQESDTFCSPTFSLLNWWWEDSCITHLVWQPSKKLN